MLLYSILNSAVKRLIASKIKVFVYITHVCVYLLCIFIIYIYIYKYTHIHLEYIYTYIFIFVTHWMERHTRMSKVRASLFNKVKAMSKGKCNIQSPTKLHKQSLSFPFRRINGWKTSHLRSYGDPTGEGRDKQRACNLETRQ